MLVFVSLADRKGMGLIFPTPGHGDSPSGTKCGNATELGDGRRGPGKSYLFFVIVRVPGISFVGDRERLLYS
ncbi:hypothetical protein JTE90_016433 [Oedothorax gibbosus]|uniref:Uncharacterized protein n=1 Tax=Oedothorax gibbosus TaxID=931172 RepID=A0AAV6TD66_9ARAC|nr:hypothetical protein JTE90_016433 [Oedothorax gibbosus]